MIPALISQSRGIAVFFHGEHFGMVDVRNPEQIIDTNSRQFAHMMAGASDIEALSVADLDALRTHLKIRREREECLHAALILLDRSYSRDVRRLAAESLKVNWRRDVWEWVEGVLFAAPLPAKADPRVAAELFDVDHLFEDLEHFQPQVKQLCNSWNLLVEYSHLRAEVVRRGLYRILIRGKAPSPANPFQASLTRYCRELRTAESSPSLLTWPEILGGTAKNSPMFDIFAVRPWHTAWAASNWSRCMWSCARTEATAIEAKLWSSQADPREVGRAWQEKLQSADVRFVFSVLRELANESNIETSSSDLILREALHRGKSLHERRLVLLLGMFDAIDLRNEAAAMSKADIHSFAWKSTDACRSIGTEVPFGFRFERDDLATASAMAQHDSDAQTARSLHEAICSFSLGVILDNGGGIIARSPEMRRSGRVVLIINPTTSKSHKLEGDLARLMTILRGRVDADAKSDIHGARCGWVHLANIAATVGKSTAWTRGAVEQCRSSIEKAGFSGEMIQADHDYVRLNPLLTTSSMDDE